MNSAEVSTSFTSPLTARMQNSTTPLRMKRKTSRRDLGLNVSASCSTPRGHRLGTLNSCFNSPTAGSSIPCSQDSPDVVWDYTSPKLPKGAKRREINITIEEFLKNLNQKQIPDCNSQASHHIKLLEKWMAHQTTVSTTKNTHKTVKLESKKRSKRVIAEIKQFMESIQNKKQDFKSPESRHISELQNNEQDARSGNTSFTNIDKKSFIEGASGSDSADELWGDLDNSFMVKATQLLEDTNPGCKNQNLDLLSTIPETVPSAQILNPAPLAIDSLAETAAEPNCLSTLQNHKDLENQTEFMLTQLLNCEWDTDSEDNWDNGFILEDDDLSQIPEEVLSGNIGKNNVADSMNRQKESCAEPCDVRLNDVQFDDELFKEELEEMVNKNKTCTTSSKDAPVISLSESTENNSGDIFNNFDDVNFDDESILSKPEVLSWIDEVENQLTQKGSQEGPKCTPEEIKKKKDEALRKRQNKQLSSKPLSR
ncbi:uncharacterized protein LOC129222692 [Uloborus diversus]|uniref:uncharacterized protein LOC129222692 n=1 Tax=Uloborus diversus TaxID=327109 RepID=UPI00240A7AFB|nr:uncharacterized protein LOC129222692 [Uloborus diversus]